MPNPYDATIEEDEVPPPLTGWAVAASVIVSLIAALGLAASGGLFWAAVLLGIPMVSFIAGHGRRRDRISTAVFGTLAALGGIIAFLPICMAIGIAAGMDLHRSPGPIVSISVCAGSVGLACGIVILLHHMRGTEDRSPTNATSNRDPRGRL